MVFGAAGHQRPNFHSFTYIHYAVPRYSARIRAIYLLPLANFGWVSFAVWNVWQRSRTQNLRRVSENFGAILSRLWAKVREISRRCRRPLVTSSVLVRLSMSRFIQNMSTLSLKIVDKPTKCKSFLALDFLGGSRPRLFYSRLYSAMYFPPLGAVWLSSIC